VGADLKFEVGATVAIGIQEDLDHLFFVEGIISMAERSPDISIRDVKGDVKEGVVMEQPNLGGLVRRLPGADVY
jgi:hypothetical protein